MGQSSVLAFPFPEITDSLRIVTTNQITPNLLHNRKTEYSKLEAVKIFIQYCIKCFFKVASKLKHKTQHHYVTDVS